MKLDIYKYINDMRGIEKETKYLTLEKTMVIDGIECEIYRETNEREKEETKKMKLGGAEDECSLCE